MAVLPTLDGATEQATAVTLLLSVTHAGAPVLGNVVIVVQHVESGRVWRGLQYHRQKERYVYHGVPTGTVLVRVRAVGYEPVVLRHVLARGGQHDVSIALRPECARPALILDASRDSQRMASLAAKLVNDHSARTRFLSAPNLAVTELEHQGGAIGLPAYIHVALLDDAALITSLTAPIAELIRSSPGLRQWIEVQLNQQWRFHLSSAEQIALTSPIVDARLRFYLIVRALFLNPVVAALHPALTETALDAHLARIIASLDTPQLDPLLPLLARVTHPTVAVVDHFARCLLTRATHLRVPASAGTLTDSANESSLAMHVEPSTGSPHAPTSGVAHPGKVTLMLGQVADLLARVLDHYGIVQAWEAAPP
jgi:hypothetical protein